MGAPFQVLRDDFPPGMVGLISSRAGFYAQDDFKITSKLTMNIGARYDIMPYPREKYNRLSNFDPATRTMLIAGQNTSERLRATDYKDLAPRVGLAYAPGFKTVIRAGYGIGFVDPVGSGSILNSNEFNIPFYFRNNITLFPFTAPTYRLSSLLPALAVPSPSAPTGDQRYLTPNDGNQYSQTWSFSVQKALSSSWMFETAYVGTSGNRLLMTSNINAAPPGTTNPVARQPFGSALGEVRPILEQRPFHLSRSPVQDREAVFERTVFPGVVYVVEIDRQSEQRDGRLGGQRPISSRPKQCRVGSWLVEF